MWTPFTRSNKSHSMSIHLPTIFSKKRTYPCEDSAPFECYFIVSMMRDLLAQYNDDNFFF